MGGLSQSSGKSSENQQIPLKTPEQNEKRKKKRHFQYTQY